MLHRVFGYLSPSSATTTKTKKKKTPTMTTTTMTTMVMMANERHYVLEKNVFRKPTTILFLCARVLYKARLVSCKPWSNKRSADEAKGTRVDCLLMIPTSRAPYKLNAASFCFGSHHSSSCNTGSRNFRHDEMLNERLTLNRDKRPLSQLLEYTMTRNR